jgi:hypothetical protein
MNKFKIGDIILLLVSSVFALVILEISFRIYSGVKVFTLDNWLIQRLQRDNLSEVSAYDEDLGWTMKPNIRSEDLNTTTYGLRYTSEKEPIITGGKILAVGDSFTAGSEVADKDSWPAHLSRILSTNVYNGAVGGWGTDQIILRAKQLIPLVKPKTVILGFLASDIERAGYKIFGGGAKPYFEIVNDQLIRYNKPVPIPSMYRQDISKAYRLMGYSYMLFQIFSKLRPIEKNYFGKQHYETIDNDVVAVTCKLLNQLAIANVNSNIKTLLVMQYGGQINSTMDNPPVFAQRVSKCASSFGIEVIDEFLSLQKIAKQNPLEFKKYYVMHSNDSIYGHMSSKGNLHIASLISNFLKNSRLHERSSVRSNRTLLKDNLYELKKIDSKFHKLDNANVLFDSDLADVCSIDLAFVTCEREKNKSQPSRSYIVTATKGEGEHYLTTGNLKTNSGKHVLSVWLDNKLSETVIIQIKNQAGNGGILEYHPESGSFSLQNLKNSKDLQAWIVDKNSSWVRVAMSFESSSDTIQGILQLVSRGTSRNFVANGESLKFYGLKIEGNKKSN